MAPKYPRTRKPSKGYVINDPSSGSIFIGKELEAKRKREIELHSASNAHIKLFEDGGFELSSQPSSVSDNINSQSKNGLAVSANNIYLDAGNGVITLKARSIILQGTGSDQNITINSNGNVEITAGDTVKIGGSVTAVTANTRMFLLARGSLYAKGSSVSLVEKKTTFLPTSLSEVIELATDKFLGI